MADSDEIGRELRGLLRDPAVVDRASALRLLCAGCTGPLSVDGAAVSVLQGDTGRGGFGASDAVAAYVDEMQYTLGEGPCQDVLANRRPVLVPDIASTGSRWPAFAAAATEAGVLAVFAFPVQVGAVILGVLDLFRGTSGALGAGQLSGALVVADLAAVTLVSSVRPLADRADAGDDPTWFEISSLGHAEVHQATGMLVVQLGVDPRAALARLRAYAFSHGLTATAVARRIVSGDLRLDRDDP